MPLLLHRAPQRSHHVAQAADLLAVQGGEQARQVVFAVT